MKYWAVGSSFGGTEDKTEEFINNNEWFDGRYDAGDFVNKKYLEKIKIDDILVVKSSATKGKGHKTTFTKVKVIGVVVKIIDVHHYKVNWLKNNKLPIDFDGVSYRKLIEPLRNDAIYIFVKNELNKIEMQNKIELLLNKKQIILQGPPGTGKTRLAKQIAKELTKPNDDFGIFNLLKVGIKIPNASGIPNYYKILKINEKNIETQDQVAINRKWRGAVKAQNIMARIKGTTNGKALVLL